MAGEPFWHERKLSLDSSLTEIDFVNHTFNISMVVPFPIFCGEIGFLLLGSNQEKFSRETSRSELVYLQWVVATFLLTLKTTRNAQSIHTESRSGLTTRQVKVYELLLSGLTNSQIAKRLNVSSSTVKNEIGTIYSRRGVRKRSELLDNHEF